MRVFIAVPLPVPVRAALLATAKALAPHLPQVRWSPKEENLHITIKFLGEISEQQLREIATGLTAALRAVPAFEIGARGIGAFPSPELATVIWAGIDDPSGTLARIAGVAEDLGASLAVAAREHGPYRAHVTLGRSKTDVDFRRAAEDLAETAFGRWSVDEVHLYESRLSPAGSTYIQHARAPLAPARPLSP